jgi:hypothetical protein
MVDESMSEHLKVEFAHHFCSRAHCLWCPKSRWSPPLGASVALKFSKNELEQENYDPQVKGGGAGRGRFYRKFSI